MRRCRALRIAAAVTLATATAASAAEPVAAPAAGDAAVGRALFIGARPTQNGGAPCGACHALGGQGLAFSASLGPDLSKAFEGMPAEALDGLLQDFPFPTMTPVYAGRPLTPGERADLAAFLVAAGGGAPAGGGARVLAWAGLVAAACLVGVAMAGRRRKGSTRAALLADARRTGEVR